MIGFALNQALEEVLTKMRVFSDWTRDALSVRAPYTRAVIVKMPIFSIEGRSGIFKGRSNISTNKYDILILPSTLFICSIPSFKGNKIIKRSRFFPLA